MRVFTTFLSALLLLGSGDRCMAATRKAPSLLPRTSSLIAALDSSEGQQAFRFETTSGEQVEGLLLETDAAGLNLLVDGVARDLGFPELLLAWNLTPVPEARLLPLDLVLLAPRRADKGLNVPGDRLWGFLLGGDEFSLQLRLDGGTDVEIPFDEVDRILPGVNRPLDRLMDLEGGGYDDRLWRRRKDGGLDGVTGVLSGMDTEGLVLESALGDLDFAFEDVLALVLAETEHPGRELEGTPVLVRLMMGSLFEAGLKRIEGGRVHLSSQFAANLTIPQADIASLLFLEREDEAELGALPLSRGEPLHVEEWPSLGGPEALLYPWRRELSVSGGPLRLAGLLRATGLGVHANARLRFAVPPGMHALRVTVGLVDEVLELPAEASVSFELLVDGESKASTGLVVEGDPPRDLRVSGLRAGQTIELLTLDGGDLDAGDRAAWVDGVFLPR